MARRRARALEFAIGLRVGIEVGRGPAAALENLRDRSAHRLKRVRLGNETGGAELEAVSDHGAVLVAGDDDDRRGRPFRSQKQQARKASDARHAQIEQHEIRFRRRLERSRHTVEIVRHGDFCFGRRSQHRLPETADHQRVIVGDQNAHHSRIHVTLRRPRGPAARPSRNGPSLSRPRHRRKSNLRVRIHPFGSRPIWRRASTRAIVAATPTLSDRNGGSMGILSRTSAAAATASDLLPIPGRRGEYRPDETQSPRVSPPPLSSAAPACGRPRRARTQNWAHESWRAMRGIRDSPCRRDESGDRQFESRPAR